MRVLTSDINGFLEKYLDFELKKNQKVKLFGGEITAASIDKLYVAMPTNFYLNISVENKTIKVVEEEVCCQGDTQIYYGNNQFEKNILNLSENKALCDTLTIHISNGDEYSFPVPSERPLILSAPWSDGYKKRYWTLNIVDVIALHDYVAILGNPGTGKSTALKYLTAMLISNVKGQSIDKDCILNKAFFEKKYIPIYIEFRKLSEFYQRIVEQEKKSISINLNMLIQYLYDEIGFTEQDVISLPEKNNYIFLFDGIDEIPNESEIIKEGFSKSILNGLVSEINSLKNENSEIKIVFTSRVSEYKEYEINNFKVAEIMPMNIFQARELVRKIKVACNNTIVDECKFLAELKEKGFGNDIVFNPMLLSLLTFVAIDKGEGKLPKNKSEVLYESIKLLLKRWSAKEENKPEFFASFEDVGQSRANDIIEQLAKFAYESEDSGQIKTESLLSFFMGKEKNPKEILSYLAKTAGLIIDDGLGFKFAHKSFRSYLAASYMCNQTNNVKLLVKEFEKCLNASDINETLSLAIDIMLEDEEEWQHLMLFIYELFNTHWNVDRTIWLIGKIFYKNKIFCEKHFVQNLLLKNPFLTRLQCVFNNSKTLPIKNRVECGYFLGLLGDARAGIGVSEVNALDIVWCPIEKQILDFGTSSETRNLIQKTPWGAEIDFAREATEKGDTIPIELNQFEISKYPITVAQFTVFLLDKEGYYNSNLYSWSDAAKEFYEKRIKSSPDNKNYYGFYLPDKFQIPNMPITHVHYFVAVAFCKWLTNSYHDSKIVRLPTEMEWEAVAKMSGNKVFLWGDNFATVQWDDQFVASNCNCLGTGLNIICSVGAFNDSIDNKPVDLIGNAWEWTSSYFTDTLGEVRSNTTINISDNKKLTTAIAQNAFITNRGGSCYNATNGLRVSFRGRDPLFAEAVDRHTFRVVRVAQEINPNYYDESKIIKVKENSMIAEGYGQTVNRGEEITILYEIKRNGQIIQPLSNLKFVLGQGIIHEVLEADLMKHRVACNIRKTITAKELFGEDGYKGIIHKDDCLEIFMCIKDTMEF